MLALSRGVRLSLFLSSIVAAAAAAQATFVKEAWADSAEKKKVAVGAFEGPKSGDARSAFIESLKKDGNYEVTDAEDVSASAKDKAIVDAAKGLGVSFVITGKVQKTTLKLKVRSGKDGKVLDEASIKGKSQANLKANVASTGAASVAGALGASKAAEAAKPPEDEKPKEEEPKEEPKEEEKPAEEAASDSDDKSGALTPLEVEAGLSGVHRTFDFHDTIAEHDPSKSPMLSYELPLGPALFIRANFYPFAFGSKGALALFGINAGFEKGFAISSVYQENVMGSELTLKTNMQHLYGGLRFRYPIGEHVLGLTGTFGQHKFVLVGDEALPFPLIPDITYTYMKVGIDGTFRFGDFLVGARIGKRFVFDTGGLEEVWFPNTSTSSLEAGVDVGYRLSSMLDLVASFDWLRYAFDFNPVPNRANTPYASYVAGGAVDQYLTGSIAVRFHLPTSGE